MTHPSDMFIELEARTDVSLPFYRWITSVCPVTLTYYLVGCFGKQL